MQPPWRFILTSPAVWAIVAAHFSENWGFYTWLTELPTFMNDVLHFDMYQVMSVGNVQKVLALKTCSECMYIVQFFDITIYDKQT